MKAEWISSETKPQHKNLVISWNGEYISLASFCGGIWIDIVFGESEVTHWMELLEPPNAPHEGRTAALSPGVPLDAVVGGLTRGT